MTASDRLEVGEMGGRPGRPSLALAALLAGSALLLTACSGGPWDAAPSPGATTAGSGPFAPVLGLGPPCPGSVTELQLGSPYIQQDHALFSTTGGEVYVTVRDFPSEGFLDPDVWRAGLHLGREGAPPVYDTGSGAVQGAILRSAVVEGTWTSLTLPAGRYWLWVTNGGDVAVASCTPGGVSEPEPATR